MSKNYNIITVDDYDDDSDVAPSQLKSRRKRKSTAGDRKIQHVWTDEEINRLIASVEQHRGLWDFTSPEYKLRKLDGWQRVADELQLDGVDANEAKVKWSSLRTTFMVNLAKLRKKKSHTIAWKFFKSMMFLEDSYKEYSTSSTSTLQLESGGINSSKAEEFAVPSPPSTTECAVANQSQCSRSRAPTPSLSPSPSPYAISPRSQAISTLNSAVSALHSSDTNATFCDNLLAELRTLSEPRARTLRFKISRLMMDFIELSQELTPISN